MSLDVKEPLRVAYRKIIQWNLSLRGDDFQYVFVLGHMRSGSTLLTHILGSHPEFAGVGETHVTYKSSADFSKLAVVTCQWQHKLTLNAKYVVDQINHNDLLSIEALSSPLLHKCVILVRSPEATLGSLIKLLNWEEEFALNYYVKRLDMLVNYSRALKHRAHLIDYDDLVNETDRTLAGLTQFMQVTTPFKSDYTTHNATGRSGDPSANIRAGRVVKTESHKVILDRATLDQASRAFEKSREELLRQTRSGS